MNLERRVEELEAEVGRLRAALEDERRGLAGIGEALGARFGVPIEVDYPADRPATARYQRTI